MVFDKSDSKLLKFNKIVAICLIVWVCLPWVTQNLRLITGVILSAFWVLSALFIDKVKVVLTKDTIFMGAWIGISLLAVIVTGRAFAHYSFMDFAPWAILFFLGYYIAHFYMKHNMTRFLAILSIVAVVSIVIGQIFSIYYSTLYPGIMKSIEKESSNIFNPLVPGHLDFEVARKLGIGGFGFVYMVMFVALALIVVLKKCQNKIVKLISIVVFAVSAACLVLSTYTTALVILVAGIIVVMISAIKNDKKRHLVYVLSLVALVVLGQIIGNVLLSIQVENLSLYERLQEIGNFLTSGEIGANMDSRLSYLQKSWNAFMSYPLLGSNFVHDITITAGAHSEWVDILGAYGLIGAIPLFATLICKFRTINRYLKEKTGHNAYGAILIVLIVFGLFDPVIRTYHIGMALFLIVPGMFFIPQLFERREKNENSLDS